MGKTLKSTEMTPLADEVAAKIDNATELIAKGKKMLDAVNEGVDPELKTYVTLEAGKITPRLTSYSEKLKKCEAIVAKFRAEVSKKDMEELEGFRSTAIKIVRLYQDSDKVTDIFKAFDTNGDGKVDENEFLGFFEKVKKPKNGDAKDDAKEKEEEVPELSEEELTRLFNYFDEDDEASISKEA